uniref:Hydroxysteroid (17-beta) dehydrogenase 2 n=1 Tax=Sander lucioperca TaxID=283035 RepID=A0A8D0AEV2_SANLU
MERCQFTSWALPGALEQGTVSPLTAQGAGWILVSVFPSAGCDSGFGLALASRLSEAGLKVFAGVLDENGAGARRLREQGSQNLQVLQLDVTHGNPTGTLRATNARLMGLWGLVNNAGVLHCPADAELHPMAAYRLCVDVNFLSAVKMSQVFLPLLRRSRGRIVNMSSMAGDVAMPMLAAYGASKAALSVFSRVMRLELSVWGVTVVTIQPAGFRTSSADAARYRDEIVSAASSEAREDYGMAYISSLPGRLSQMSRQSAEDLSPVVDAVCHALLAARPKALYTPGRMGWFLPFLQRCCPARVFDAVIMALAGHSDCKPCNIKEKFINRVHVS